MMLTKKPNRANTCNLCHTEYMITVVAYTPVRVMVSCCCNVQFISAEEAKRILSQVANEITSTTD